MNTFIKQHWLKGIALVVVIAVLIAGNFFFRSSFHAGECVQDSEGYTWNINNYSFGKYTVMGWQESAWGNAVTMEKSVLERNKDGVPVYHRVVCPEYHPVENAQAEVVQVATQTPKKIETKTSAPSRIINQIKAFDDYLEYRLVGAQLDCTAYATYNNVLTTKQMNAQEFQQAFPESKESYENTCRTSYLDVAMNQKILVAEPELQSLRTLLTSYAEEAKAFAQYALNGGAQGSYIDAADKRMDNLRTLSREEVLKLKRQYNVE